MKNYIVTFQFKKTIDEGWLKRIYGERLEDPDNPMDEEIVEICLEHVTEEDAANAEIVALDQKEITQQQLQSIKATLPPEMFKEIYGESYLAKTTESKK